MGLLDFFTHHSDDFDAVSSGHKGSITHELLAGAAAFEAAKAYEKHCAEQGKPVSHAKAKELLAGFAGAFIDKMIETKGLDAIDREKAKREAKKRAEESFATSGEF